jgi:hypothetical protein
MAANLNQVSLYVQPDHKNPEISLADHCQFCFDLLVGRHIGDTSRIYAAVVLDWRGVISNNFVAVVCDSYRDRRGVNSILNCMV